MTNQSTELKISAVKFDGYKIELTTNIKSQPVARFYKFITVGKNKGQYKLIEGYYFGNEEKREDWVKKTFDRIKSNIAEKKNKQAKKAEVRSNFKNPFLVGEIYYDSWGYDQTNIDFYQIVEVKEKSVMVQTIGRQQVPGTGGYLCGNVKPDPSKKIGDPFLKPVLFTVRNDGSIDYHIKSRHGWISKYDAGERGVYESHYA